VPRARSSAQSGALGTGCVSGSEASSSVVTPPKITHDKVRAMARKIAGAAAVLRRRGESAAGSPRRQGLLPRYGWTSRRSTTPTRGSLAASTACSRLCRVATPSARCCPRASLSSATRSVPRRVLGRPRPSMEDDGQRRSSAPNPAHAAASSAVRHHCSHSVPPQRGQSSRRPSDEFTPARKDGARGQAPWMNSPALHQSGGPCCHGDELGKHAATM
jgi:hypothetical protein